VVLQERSNSLRQVRAYVVRAPAVALLRASDGTAAALSRDCSLFPVQGAIMGTMMSDHSYRDTQSLEEEDNMDGLIYLIGLIVIIMAILSFFGLR
jgi:hypothetical protein